MRIEHGTLDALDRESFQHSAHIAATCIEEARIVPTDSPEQIRATGRLYAVLPKGKRSNGYLINGRRVLVKETP